MTFAKQIIIIFFIHLLFCFHSYATVYTFENGGNYTEVSNWDVYPGTYLEANDTISIEANCYGIDLFAFDGYIVFSENVFDISIEFLDVSDECQLEFKADYFNLSISGFFNYSTNNQVLIPNYAYVIIDNGGYGIFFNGCPFWSEYVNVEYYNYGTQNSILLGCFEGDFYNYGTIDVEWDFFDLNLKLYLEDGTINGLVPFVFYQYNGSLNQSCSTCTATINNIEVMYLNWKNKINGKVILNAPD